MEDRSYYIEMIERFFNDIKADASNFLVEDTEETKIWEVFRGSSQIFIRLDFEKQTLRIISPMIYLPGQKILALYRTCLEINASLPNCALYAQDDMIGIVHYRSLTGLDEQEFRSTLDLLSATSDDLDNIFKDEFGATIYTEKV